MYLSQYDVSDSEAETAERKDLVAFAVAVGVGGFVGACLLASLLIYCCFSKKTSKKMGCNNQDGITKKTFLVPVRTAICPT